MTSKNNKEEKLKQEIKQLKETCNILSNPITMKGIAISIQQIKRGETKPLSELII